ncbi:hypothetical protein BKA69DRAFT_1039179 [Paraphysoderma sedebokerense]|nr:hypothetical protein BKA69DRAFT_1039179 [Paraphysoderma sedebokerense]
MSTFITVILFIAGTPFGLLQSYFDSEYAVTNAASALTLGMVFQTLKTALHVSAGCLDLSMGLGRLQLFESLLSPRIQSICRFISKVTPYYTVVFTAVTLTNVIERMPTSDVSIITTAMSIIKPTYLIMFGIIVICVLFADLSMVLVVFRKSYEFQKEDKAMLPLVTKVLAAMCLAILVLLSAVTMEVLNLDKTTILGATELMLQIYFTLHLYVLRGVKEFVKENRKGVTESRKPQSSVSISKSGVKSFGALMTVPGTGSKSELSFSLRST